MNFYCVVIGGVVGLVYIYFFGGVSLYICVIVRLFWVRLCFWESVLACIYFGRFLFFLCLILFSLFLCVGDDSRLPMRTL